MSQPTTTASVPVRPLSRSETARAAPIRETVAGSSGYSPALPRIPSVPKRERMFCGVYVTGEEKAPECVAGAGRLASGRRYRPAGPVLPPARRTKRSVSSTSWTRRRSGLRPRAPDGDGAGGERLGEPLGGGRPESGAEERLARRPDDDGHALGREEREAGEEGEVLVGRLAEPEAGVEEEPVGTDPGDEARGGGRGRGRPPRRRRRRGRTATLRTSSTGRPSCGSGRSPRPFRTTSSRSPSGGSSPVTRLTTSAPASRARRATSTRRVSTEIGIDGLAARIPSTTGRTRASSSSTVTSPAPSP